MRPSAACFSAPTAAQGTLGELDQEMESRDQSLEAFRERLNGPDPERALAAMHMLIARGDADERRMALRHGLYSTDPATRATVLRGHRRQTGADRRAIW